MCRGCVADRWGPEALVITEDDGRLGFGRSAVIERHRVEASAVHLMRCDIHATWKGYRTTHHLLKRISPEMLLIKQSYWICKISQPYKSITYKQISFFRALVTSLRHPPSTSTRRSRTPVRTLWVELPDYFDVAFRPSAPPGIITVCKKDLKLERIETSLPYNLD